ncbi:MAG TPA: hypothetical protein QGF05_13125 [Dehalococcoidia bacterium]|nr:hypothetical protein [Dehalococcoidia bacterium]
MTSGASGRTAPIVDLPADIVAFSRECQRRDWSDGLPLIPPTEERVGAMLAGVDRDPLEVLGVLSPRQGEATIHAIAVNAVMAGCEPAHLGIVAAAIEGLTDPLFNLAAVNATTHPNGVFILASGPAARAAGIHGGAGCFGPAFPANVAIGRAVRLVLLNVAGATPGRGDRATQGTPAKISFCASEREDASPWPPFQTTRGLRADESCVTVFSSEAPHNIQDHGSNTADGILQTVAGAMGQAGSNHILSRGEPLLAFGPEHAATVAAEGWTRESVQEHLFQNARYDNAKLSAEFLEAVAGRMEGTLDPEHDDGPADISQPLPLAFSPESIHIIIAGGPGKHSSWMPSFGGMTQPITVPLA